MSFCCVFRLTNWCFAHCFPVRSYFSVLLSFFRQIQGKKRKHNENNFKQQTVCEAPPIGWLKYTNDFVFIALSNPWNGFFYYYLLSTTCSGITLAFFFCLLLLKIIFIVFPLPPFPLSLLKSSKAVLTCLDIFSIGQKGGWTILVQEQGRSTEC